jgi:hypothetical protein
MYKVAAIALALACVSAGAQAQGGMRISGGAQSPSPTQRPFRFAPPQGRRALIGLTGHPLRRAGSYRRFDQNPPFYGGWPYFTPEYDAYEPEPMPPTLQVVPPTPIKDEPIPGGVLLERQGNRWVKVSSFTAVVPSESAATSFADGSPRELPPTVLVYRDGHTEELSSYSIIGMTIFTKADYLASGKWTRKIEIANVDLPATVKRNQELGLKFEVPSGPDEVILRP